MNRFNILLYLSVLVLAVIFTTPTMGQENDPTAKSDILNKTISKIRDVERLDTFIQQNKVLQDENKKLKQTIASIQKELTKIKATINQQELKIRKQFEKMPTFQVQSKVISGKNSVAYLKTQETSLRIRANSEMSVPVKGGGWVLMKVKEISKDMIVLEFPELERTLYLYH